MTLCEPPVLFGFLVVAPAGQQNYSTTESANHHQLDACWPSFRFTAPSCQNNHTVGMSWSVKSGLTCVGRGPQKGR